MVGCGLCDDMDDREIGELGERASRPGSKVARLGNITQVENAAHGRSLSNTNLGEISHDLD